jgi:metal-responsive CopG/Arc/MetJ family transcriptional regulator
MTNRITTKRVSLDFPIDMIEEIDEICRKSFMSKRKWFIDAAMDKLEKEKDSKIDKLVRG